MYQRSYQKSNAGTCMNKMSFFSGKASVLRAKEKKDPFFQTKLQIGQPGDRYEVEADAMASKVVSSLQGSSSKKRLSGVPVGIQTKCDQCGEEEQVRAKPYSGSSEKTANGLKRSLGEANGFAMPGPLRQKMESAFRADFSQVRIHTDSKAIQMSKAINAQAFTYGTDVYFNANRFDPESVAGQHLLAHELTHVLQQTGTVHRHPENNEAKPSVQLPEKEEFLPGYTQCDFIDHRIGYHAQWALYTLYLRGGTQRGDAISMLGAVKNGMLQGIFKEDYGKPAKMAQRHGMGWWQLVPKGLGATVFEPEQPPMMVYKNKVANNRNALADALLAAWESSSFEGKAIIVPPPSFKPCGPAPTPVPTPTPEPDDGCPPGLILDKENDICTLPGKSDTECTDAEMDRAFQREQDNCAHIRSSIDLLCAFSPSPCGGATKNLALKKTCELMEKIFGKQIPGSKHPACTESRAKFYERCTVSSVIGNRKNMSCFPGRDKDVLRKYRQWPGRIK